MDDYILEKRSVVTAFLMRARISDIFYMIFRFQYVCLFVNVTWRKIVLLLTKRNILYSI